MHVFALSASQMWQCCHLHGTGSEEPSSVALRCSMKGQIQRRAWNKHLSMKRLRYSRFTKSSPSNFCVCLGVDLWPTWIALGYSVDVGSVEDTDSCASLILHAHAHAETQSGQADHQEHHAKDDARNCGAPGTNTHKVGFISKSAIMQAGLQSQENDAMLPTTEGPGSAGTAVLSHSSRRCQRSEMASGRLKDSWWGN